MQQADIREHLIDRLTPIFGKPKNADGLAAELVSHAPSTASPSDLTGLADRIIATRKTKGFPAAGELITAVKALVPSHAAVGESGIEGEITADGEIPMTWILADDPRWRDLCAIARAANRKNKHYPMTSKHAPGLGSWFRSEYVRGVPITEPEKLVVASLYARARRQTGVTQPEAAGTE